MGLAHSGDLCDATLDSLAESWSTDPVVLREHGVRLYVRFRDDIFFIGSDRRLSVSYVQELRRKAKFFHIIAECPSDSEVQFLEVKVWKSGARYHTVPCPKPTSLGIPLDVTSAHPAQVHLSWPVGTISRVQGLSTHREHAESAKATLVNRFRRHHAPSFLIELLNRTPAWKSNLGLILSFHLDPPGSILHTIVSRRSCQAPPHSPIGRRDCIAVSSKSSRASVSLHRDVSSSDRSRRTR